MARAGVLDTAGGSEDCPAGWAVERMETSR